MLLSYIYDLKEFQIELPIQMGGGLIFWCNSGAIEMERMCFVLPMDQFNTSPALPDLETHPPPLVKATLSNPLIIISKMNIYYFP